MKKGVTRQQAGTESEGFADIQAITTCKGQKKRSYSNSKLMNRCTWSLEPCCRQSRMSELTEELAKQSHRTQGGRLQGLLSASTSQENLQQCQQMPTVPRELVL